MADFGLQIEPGFGFEYDDVLKLAQELGANGFSSISVTDHFMLNSGKPDRNCMESWTLLTALATAVKDIRIGTAATCASYRNPALLARMAATVDHISNGRLDFGIGAGWKDVEYEAYGYDFPSTAQRVKQLEEALQIVKLLWTEPVASFKGEHYWITDAVLAPKPVQKPGPPVIISGAKTRMLRVMAEHADVVNFVPQPDPEQYANSLDSLRKMCEENGRDFNSIRKSHFLPLLIGANDQEVEARLDRVAAREGTTADQWRARRSRAFVGTTAEAVDLLGRYTDLGVSLFTVVFPFEEEADSMKLMADEIIGKL